MSDKEVQIAKEAITNYFASYSLENEVVIGEISKLENLKENVLFGYTGLIAISGTYEGGLYITCNENFLSTIYTIVMNEKPGEPLKAFLSDLVGEMVNTVSGYFQKEYGENFIISIPYAILGSSELGILKRSMESNFYLVPFLFRGQESHLGFSISRHI